MTEHQARVVGRRIDKWLRWVHEATLYLREDGEAGDALAQAIYERLFENQIGVSTDVNGLVEDALSAVAGAEADAPREGVA